MNLQMMTFLNRLYTSRAVLLIYHVLFQVKLRINSFASFICWWRSHIFIWISSLQYVFAMFIFLFDIVNWYIFCFIRRNMVVIISKFLFKLKFHVLIFLISKRGLRWRGGAKINVFGWGRAMRTMICVISFIYDYRCPTGVKNDVIIIFQHISIFFDGVNW